MHFQIILLIIFLALSTNTCNAQNKPNSKTQTNIRQITSLNNARSAHTATRLLDGKVLIGGGMQKNGLFYDEAEVFDPLTDSFTRSKSKMIKKRVSHTATLLKDGRVLIVGGWSNRNSPERSAEIYDPKTETFVAVGNTKFARSGHSSTLLENGKVLIAGGYDGERNLSKAELFDPTKNTFENIDGMKIARNVHSATKLKDGKVLIAGGELKRGEIVSDAEIFDPKTNEFRKISKQMKSARYKHDAVLLLDGSVLIIGGSDERDRGGKLKSAEIFDPEKEIFTRTKDMNFARFKIGETATLLNDGKVLIAGGSVDAEIFDQKTRSFETVSGNLGKSLHYSTVTLLGDGRALIVGGYEFVQAGEPISTDQAWIFKLSHQ